MLSGFGLFSTPVDPIDVAAKAAALEVGAHTYNIELHGSNKVAYILIGCFGSGSDKQKELGKYMNRVMEELKEKNERNKNNSSYDPVTIPIIGIAAGDVHYPKGPKSSTDPEIRKRNQDIYGDLDIPLWYVPGNHDLNYGATYYLGLTPQGEKIGLKLVATTYLPDGKVHGGKKYESINELKELFKQKSLDPLVLQTLNFPNLFYGLKLGQLRLLGLNSNCLERDFLNYLHDPNDKTNQINWLIRKNKKSKEKNETIALVLHHPIEDKVSKRAWPWEYDSHHYLYQDQITALNETFKQDKLFTVLDEYLMSLTPEQITNIQEKIKFLKTPNEILAMLNQHLSEKEMEQLKDRLNSRFKSEFLQLILARLDINPAMINNAHAHAINIFNNKEDQDAKKKFFQITSGAGGETLHSREGYANYPYDWCYIGNDEDKDYGFCIVTFDANHPKVFIVDVYTLKEYHLRFNSESHHPLREKSKDPLLEMFREQILQECDLYFKALKKRDLEKRHADDIKYTISPLEQISNKAMGLFYSNTAYSLTINKKEAACAQEIMVYLNQYELSDLKTTVEYINKLMQNLPRDENSFFRQLSKSVMNKTKLQEIYGLNSLRISDFESFSSQSPKINRQQYQPI